MICYAVDTCSEEKKMYIPVVEHVTCLKVIFCHFASTVPIKDALNREYTGTGV